MPINFTVKLTDEYGKTLEAIEGVVQRIDDLDAVFGQRGGEMCRAWAQSRLEMYQTKGGSTGAPWPGYTQQEQRYYLPMKRAALGRFRLPNNTLLRFSKSASWSPEKGERLYPGLTEWTHSEFLYQRPGPSTVLMGTKVPWAYDVDRGTGEWVSGTYRGRTRGGRSRRARHRHVVKAPARKLMRLGEPFIEVFRKLLQKAMLESGGRAGLSTSEVFDRINPKGRRGG